MHTLKSKSARLLQEIDTDRHACERALTHVACTGSNDDLRAVLARMKYRATLHAVPSAPLTRLPESGKA